MAENILKPEQNVMKKKESIHNYIHFALHLNNSVETESKSLCWHARKIKDMQIASIDSVKVLQIHQELL